MRLVFNQTFSGPLNPSVWGTCYPWAAGATGCTNFGNKEYEWYLPSQVQVAGGALHLIATPQATAGRTKTGQPAQYSCRSGMVTSYPGFRFEYGYVSMVAQIPSGTGLWPGLWLAAANLKWPPEIDIFEGYGPPVNLGGAYFHPLNAPAAITHVSPATLAGLASGWHTFSVSWTSQKIVWYIDGMTVMVITSNIPQQPMYLVADLASFTQTGCSGQLLIKSIDVWQAP
jgi:beta-glucanase (GH16 family)